MVRAPIQKERATPRIARAFPLCVARRFADTPFEALTAGSRSRNPAHQPHNATLADRFRQATTKSVIHNVVPYKAHLSRFDPPKGPLRQQSQTACKPGSVPPPGTMPGSGDGHSSGTLVTERLVRPTRAAARRLARHLRITPGCLPLLLGLAPGGVFPAAAVAGGAVRSYRTVSPLPPARRAEAGWRCTFCGTFPGVAPAGRYPAPCLRGARTFLPSQNAKSGHPTVWHGIMWDAAPILSKCPGANRL